MVLSFFSYIVFSKSSIRTSFFPIAKIEEKKKQNQLNIAIGTSTVLGTYQIHTIKSGLIL